MVLSSLSWIQSWFTPAAPPEAANDPAVPPQTAPPEAANDGGLSQTTFGLNDPLGAGRALAFQSEDVGAAQGWGPSWAWVSPPGVGDAPQHVWHTYNLFPVALDGPGDRPATYFRWKVPPVIANFAMRWQGMPVDGGNLLMTGLYVPAPLEQAANGVYYGS